MIYGFTLYGCLNSSIESMHYVDSFYILIRFKVNPKYRLIVTHLLIWYGKFKLAWLVGLHNKDCWHSLVNIFSKLHVVKKVNTTYIAILG